MKIERQGGKRMKLVQLLTILLFFAASPSFADTASQAASDYFNVLKQKDYERAANYFDPVALAEFRQMMDFIYEVPDEVQQKVFTTFFGPGASKESINKMSDALYFAAFLRAIMAQAEKAGSIDFEKMEILGEVMEGEHVAHVVTRNRVKVGQIEVEAMEVVSFRKDGKQWKALMSGKIKGIPNQLRVALTQQ